MTRPYLRPVELALGVVVLLSVASVPVPRATMVSAARPAADVGYIARVETLHRQAQAQQQDVIALTEQTRQLSELLRIQQESEAPRSARVASRRRGSQHTEVPGTVLAQDPHPSELPAMGAQQTAAANSFKGGPAGEPHGITHR